MAGMIWLIKVNQINPRKDTYLFGAKGSDTKLHHLPKSMIIVPMFLATLIFYGAGKLSSWNGHCIFLLDLQCQWLGTKRKTALQISLPSGLSFGSSSFLLIE